MTESPAKTRKRIVWEYTEAIITALVLALIIRAFVVQAFKIPTGSMIPTLVAGDHILVNKFIYGARIPFTDTKVLAFINPVKGDIIVFRYPEDHDRDFIKRIIAVGGDVVEGKNKAIYVNGVKTVEPYAQFTDTDIISARMGKRDNFGPLTVPENKLFMMGDNRDNSHDSRFWGFADISDIRGKAMIIYWSWDSKKRSPRVRRMGKVVR